MPTSKKRSGNRCWNLSKPTGWVIAAVIATRIAACWRNGQLYELRDTNGALITPEEGRAICAERYKIDPVTRAARRTTNPGAARAGRDRKESQSAPVTSPPHTNATHAA